MPLEILHIPLCLTAWPLMVNAHHHWTHLETITGDTASHPRRLESSSCIIVGTSSV